MVQFRDVLLSLNRLKAEGVVQAEEHPADMAEIERDASRTLGACAAENGTSFHVTTLPQIGTTIDTRGGIRVPPPIASISFCRADS